MKVEVEVFTRILIFELFFLFLKTTIALSGWYVIKKK